MNKNDKNLEQLLEDSLIDNVNVEINVNQNEEDNNKKLHAMDDHQLFTKAYDEYNNKHNSMKKEVIEDYSKLRVHISKIKNEFEKNLRQSEEDFLYAYKDQMLQIQKELQALKKKMDEETLKQKADEKMNILEEERDYFRAEALRLDRICKDQLREIDELKFKMRIINEDKSYYEGFVIETKKENKALKAELLYLYKHKISKENHKFQMEKLQEQQGLEDDDIKSIKDTMDDRPFSPDIEFSPKKSAIHNNLVSAKSAQTHIGATNNYIDKDKERPFFATQADFNQRAQSQHQGFRKKVIQNTSNHNNNDNDIKMFNEQKYIETIKQLRQYVDKEKQSNRKLKVELSVRNSVRNELEEQLLDLVNEAKKDIYKRRKLQKNDVRSSAPNLNGVANNLFESQNFENIQYDQFSHTDKLMLLKKFITSDNFLDEIYQITFGKYRQNKDQQVVQQGQRKFHIMSGTTQLSPTNAPTSESWKQDFSQATTLYKNSFQGFRYNFSAKSQSNQFGKNAPGKKDMEKIQQKFSARSDNINKIRDIKIKTQEGGNINKPYNQNIHGNGLKPHLTPIQVMD